MPEPATPVEQQPLGQQPSVGTPGLPDIQSVRGADYPLPGDQDAAVRWVTKLYDAGQTDALARYKQGAKHILYANGRQRIGWNKRTAQYEDMPISENDVHVVMNYIVVILRSRVERLTSASVGWRIIPEDNSNEAQDRARLARDFVTSRYQGLEMEHKFRAGLLQASMTGIVAMKSFWNPNLGPLKPATKIFAMPNGTQQELPVDANGQPVEDPAQAMLVRPGDTDTTPRSFLNLRLNPEAQGWTEGEGFRWLIDEDVVPLAVARELFVKYADKIRADGQIGSSLTYERMIRSASVQKELGGMFASPYAGTAHGTGAQEMCAIREYWEAKSLWFPRGRLIVVVGGHVCYDGEWPDGVLPYSPLYGEPAVMSPYGFAPVAPLIPPQDVINDEVTAIAREMKASGIGQFVGWDVPGVPDQINASEKNVIRIPMRSVLASRPIKDVLSRLDPAHVSSDRWNLLEQAKATMFDIGAYHEISRGQIPPGLDSGVAIQQLIEQETAQMKPAVDSFRRTMIQWARHQLAIARQHYTSERWLPVARPDLGYLMMGVTGAQLPDPETIGIDIENFRPQSESAVRAEIKELMVNRLVDPARGLKAMDLGAGFEEVFDSRQRDYVKARWENLAFEQGMAMPVAPRPMGDAPDVGGEGQGGEEGALVPALPEFAMPDGAPMYSDLDDHMVHVEVHRELALDVTKPYAIRAAAEAHAAMHMMALAAAQAAQQPEGEDEPDENSSSNQE